MTKICAINRGGISNHGACIANAETILDDGDDFFP
jgi:hypothetical protein